MDWSPATGEEDDVDGSEDSLAGKRNNANKMSRREELFVGIGDVLEDSDEEANSVSGNGLSATGDEEVDEEDFGAQQTPRRKESQTERKSEAGNWSLATGDEEEGDGDGFEDAPIGEQNGDGYGEGDGDPETESNDKNWSPAIADEEDGYDLEDTPVKK